MYSCVSVHMSVYHMCAWCMLRSEDFESPGIEVKDSCEHPFAWLELNTCLLEAQYVLLKDKPYLQPQKCDWFLKHVI